MPVRTTPVNYQLTTMTEDSPAASIFGSTPGPSSDPFGGSGLSKFAYMIGFTSLSGSVDIPYVQSINVDRPNPTSFRWTLGQRPIIEHADNRQATIELRGRSGIDDRLGTDSKGDDKFANGPTLLEEFKKFLEQYQTQRSKYDHRNAQITRMTFHAKWERLNLLVEPVDFSFRRTSGSSRHSYEWSLILKAYGDAKQLPKTLLDIVEDWVTKIADFLANITMYIAMVGRTIDLLKGIIDTVTVGLIGALTALINAVANVLNSVGGLLDSLTGVTMMQKLHALSESVANVVVAAINVAPSSWGALDGGQDPGATKAFFDLYEPISAIKKQSLGLVGVSGSKSNSDYSATLSEIKSQLVTQSQKTDEDQDGDLIEDLQKRIDETLEPTITMFNQLASELPPSAIPQSAANTKSMVGGDVTVIDHVVQGFESLKDISEKYYGPMTGVGLAQFLATYNDIAISWEGTSSSSKLVEGSKLKVPLIGAEALGSIPGATPPYGVDLKLSEDGDLILNADDSLRLVSGVPNFLQALKLRLTTPQGEASAFPNYGLPATVGKRSSASAVGMAAASVRTQVLSDPRTKEVEDVEVIDDGDHLMVRCDVTSIGGGSTVELVSPLLATY